MSTLHPSALSWMSTTPSRTLEVDERHRRNHRRSRRGRLLNTEPLALLIGMLLDQQVPMEWAFKGPALLKERLGGTLDADGSRRWTPKSSSPSSARSRRSTGSPAPWPGGRTTCASSSRALRRRRREHLAGRGPARSSTRGCRPARLRRGEGEDLHRDPGEAHGEPAGWEAVAGPFADMTPRSVADIDSPGLARQGAGVEEDDEGEGQVEEGLDACRAWPAQNRSGRSTRATRVECAPRVLAGGALQLALPHRTLPRAGRGDDAASSRGT